MNLSEIRAKFVELSGRYELMNDDGSDNGADWYINEGMRFLDRKINHRKSKASFFRELEIGEWYAEFEHCRAIREVWVNNGTIRVKLERKTVSELKDLFNGVIEADDYGSPQYFAPSTLRSTDLVDKDNLGEFYDRKVDDSHNLHGVLILPPPDEKVIVEVVGKFYSEPLENDEDENYWTSEHSGILLKAALYELEGFYRNSEGMKDWLSFMTIDIEDLDKDEVLDSLDEDSLMEG